MPTIRPEAASTLTGSLRGAIALSHPPTNATALTIPGPTLRAQFASGGDRENAILVGDRTRLVAIVTGSGTPSNNHEGAVVGWLPCGDVMVPVLLAKFTCNPQAVVQVGSDLATALDSAGMSVHFFCDTYIPTAGADYPFLLNAGSNNDDGITGPLIDVSAFQYVETIVIPDTMMFAAACLATLY